MMYLLCNIWLWPLLLLTLQQCQWPNAVAPVLRKKTEIDNIVVVSSLRKWTSQAFLPQGASTRYFHQQIFCPSLTQFSHQGEFLLIAMDDFICPWSVWTYRSWPKCSHGSAP